MGRNGSGKSTLLKQMVGLLKPDEGQVTVAGLDTRKAELDDIIKTVGYVPQHPGALLFGDTLAAELAFTRRGHGMPADPAADQALLERLRLGRRWRTATRATSAAASSSARPWRASWSQIRRSSCWTSRLAAWTMRRNAA